MEEIVAEHSGPLEKVSKDMERDYFMTAEEAKQYGLIDKVLARLRVTPKEPSARQSSAAGAGLGVHKLGRPKYPSW